jgi:hypothetical protein
LSFSLPLSFVWQIAYHNPDSGRLKIEKPAMVRDEGDKGDKGDEEEKTYNHGLLTIDY